MATQSTDTAKPRVRTQADELMVIAQRAQAFTNASGTAIALSEGNTEEFTCRARSGSAAPEVGTSMRLEGSFTGLCVQTGKELRCDDAETDTRVDTNAIRALGIRSMVVTPIREDNKVIGVLACFAPTAHAFTITHVAVLKTMADQISGLLQRDRRMREEGVLPEPAPTASFPKTAPAAPSMPAAVVIKPAVPNGNGSAAAAAPAKSAFPVVSRVEIAKPAESAAAATPKREEKRPEARANFGTLDAMSAKESKSGANVKMLAAVAVVVIVALGTFAFLKMRKPAAPAAPQVAASTPAPQPQESSNSQIQVSATPTGNPQNNSVASSNSAAEPAKPAKASSENSKKSEKSAKNSEKAVQEEPEAKPTPATVALNRGPSRIGSAAAVPAGEVSPTLAVESGSATGTISALTIPVNTSAPAALRQSNLEPMQVIKTVPPIYPAIAKMRRLSGQVMVEFTVGKDGKAHNPKLLSGQAAFKDAAFEAVRQWTFKPAKLDGKAIEQTTQVKMDFHP